MTQQAVISHLNISARTLQRYVQKGRLTVRYEQGKTRPVPTYDEAEIAALKASLCHRPVFPQRKATEQKKQPFGFRLLPDDIAKLTQEAARYAMTPGEYARSLVQTGLESGLQSKVNSLTAEIAVLRQELASVNKALKALKNELADTTEIVLEYVGMESAAAHHWTNVNLRARKQAS